MKRHMHRLEDYTIAALTTLFVASLIIFDLSENVLYSNILNLLLWAFFGVVFILKPKHRFTFTNMTYSYIAFTVFSLCSVLWALDFYLAFTYAIRLVVVTVNLIILHAIFKRYELENTVLYGILLGAFYNYLIAFNLISVNYEIYEFSRLTGSVGNANKLAKVMLISIFASLILLSFAHLKSYFRIYNYINILLSSYLIFLTVSKKAIILAPVLILASVSIKHMHIKNILLFIIVVIFSYEIFVYYTDVDYLADMYDLFIKRFAGMVDALYGYAGDDSSSEREQLLIQGVDVFSSNPVIGIGLNNFRLLAGKYAHNNYLELLTGVGIIGTVLFYSIYIFLFAKIFRMPASLLRKYFLVMTFILLVMDLATVSYFNKLILFILLYMYYVADINKKPVVHAEEKGSGV